MINKKSLPKGFRYFFTQKEVKEIEKSTNIKFDVISFGNIANSEKLNQEDKIQSNIHPISISVRLIESTLKFDFSQFGFRNELLPNELEIKAKEEMADLVKAYLIKISSSRQTDLLKQPQLWAYCKVINKEVLISGKELN